MHLNNKLITAMLIVGAVSQVAESQRQCFSDGTDCSCNPTMVRHPPRPTGGGDCGCQPPNNKIVVNQYPGRQEMEPTGDVYSCNTPAVTCSNCETSCSSGQCDCCSPYSSSYGNCRSPPAYFSGPLPPPPPINCQGPPYTPDPPGLYIPEYLNHQESPTSSCYSACEPAPPSVPVDPVSLAIAYSNAQKGYNIREDKLNFGAIRKPVDCETVETICSGIPEDGLYSLRNQIVELKPTCRRTISPAEEAALSYFEEEEDGVYDCNENSNYPTYRDLGYVPECPSCSTFQPGAPAPSQSPRRVIYDGPSPSACPYPGNQGGQICYQQNDDCYRDKGDFSTLMRRFSPKPVNCVY